MADWLLRRSDRAEQDLFEIWAYIAFDDETAAERTIDIILAAFRRAEQFPRVGSMLSWLPEDHRTLVSGAYLLIYQIIESKNEVLLVRVLHGARDLPIAFETE